jgi:hypothetical protein
MSQYTSLTAHRIARLRRGDPNITLCLVESINEQRKIYNDHENQFG